MKCWSGMKIGRTRAESLSVAILGLHRCILFPFSSCGPKTKSNMGHITCLRPVVEAPRCHIPMLLNLRNRFRKEGHAKTNLIPWSCPKPDRSVPRHGAFRRSSRDTSEVPLADRGRERPHPGTSDVSTPPASSLGRGAAWAAKSKQFVHQHQSEPDAVKKRSKKNP